ncbi:MAG: MBL fold metallo-hydrolase [Methylacidiphilales bacterium]|nr:MBL fold metallo-hydrolase [Candidatus Methylacidiphilales bacterium]
MPYRYKNRYLVSSGSGVSKKEVRKWMWNKLLTKRTHIPRKLIIGQKPDLELIQSQSDQSRITWVGHATFLLQHAKCNILTDPHFSKRASPVSWLGPKRHQPPGIDLKSLPVIDLVLLSHNHYDHLDYLTVQYLVKHHNPLFIVPVGVEQWFYKKTNSKKIISLSWGESTKFEDLVINFLPVQHWSARSFYDTCDTLWGSFMLQGKNNFTFWFSGDLGFSQDIVDIAKLFPHISIATIPIGAYQPQFIMKQSHLNPAEAVRVFNILKPKLAIAHHWGTFERLTDEPLDEPPILLKQELAKQSIDQNEFIVMKHGQTVVTS